MSEHALFYDGWEYGSDSFSEWLRKFFTTGVFAGDLQVTANGGMTVKVGTGYVNVDGKIKNFENATTFTISPAHSTYSRIDTIVVERNDEDRDFTLEYIQGSYLGSTPTPTEPVRGSGVYQLVLAQITVGAGVTQITQSVIEDTRALPELCGIVTGTVEEMDFSQFKAQFDAYYDEFKDANEADFLAWYDEMKDQLSEDAAGNLQEQIDNLYENSITSLDDAMELTEAGFLADALLVKELAENIQIAETLPADAAQHPSRIYLTFS